jgi:hypothetical protein
MFTFKRFILAFLIAGATLIPTQSQAFFGWMMPWNWFGPGWGWNDYYYPYYGGYYPYNRYHYWGRHWSYSPYHYRAWGYDYPWGGHYYPYALPSYTAPKTQADK